MLPLRKFLKRGALFLPTVFVPRLIRAQAFSFRDVAAMGKAAQSAPAAQAFSWTPTGNQIDWDDTNGEFNGTLATFNSTADKPTVSAIRSFGESITAFLNLFKLTALGTFTFNSGSFTGTALDFSNCTTLFNAATDSTSLLTVDFTGCSALSTVTLNSCSSLASVNFTGCTNVATVNAGSIGITSLNLSGKTGLGTCQFESCPSLASVDLTGCSADDATFDFASCGSLTSVTLTGCGGFGLNVQLSDCALGQTAVNNVYIQLDTAGGTGGTANTSGNTTPNGAGATAVASLIVKGWTVTTF